jgi:hypothetical protein
MPMCCHLTQFRSWIRNPRWGGAGFGTAEVKRAGLEYCWVFYLHMAVVCVKSHLRLFLPIRILVPTSAYLTRWWSQTTIYIYTQSIKASNPHFLFRDCLPATGEPLLRRSNGLTQSKKIIWTVLYLWSTLDCSIYVVFRYIRLSPGPLVGSMLLDQPSIVKWMNISYPLFISH